MKTTGRKILAISLFSLLFLVFQTRVVRGAGVCEPCPCDPGLECVYGVCYDPSEVVACPPIENPSIWGIIAVIINIIFYVSVISALPMLIVGGLLYLTSAGNPKQLEKAKRIIVYALIGLSLALSSYAIGSLLKYFTPT